MFGGFVNSAVNAAMDGAGFAQTESFDSPTGYSATPFRTMLAYLLTIVIMLTILAFVGKYLWNNVLVSLVSVVRPVKSMWQILGLAILLSLFQPGCC
jgi:hypothetical protein